MEYLNHGDLQNYLSHTPQLSEPEGRDISFQILEGLHCMHQNGFAHRDLKPSVSFPALLKETCTKPHKEHSR